MPVPPSMRRKGARHRASLEFHAAAVADPVWSMPIRCSAEKFDLVDVANPRGQDGSVTRR